MDRLVLVLLGVLGLGLAGAVAGLAVGLVVATTGPFQAADVWAATLLGWAVGVAAGVVFFAVAKLSRRP